MKPSETNNIHPRHLLPILSDHRDFSTPPTTTAAQAYCFIELLKMDTIREPTEAKVNKKKYHAYSLWSSSSLLEFQ